MQEFLNGGKIRRYFGLLLILSQFQLSSVTAQERHPDKAICTVCALAGDTKSKKVKARTEYRGKAYTFCSKNCKREFDSDPVAFLPPQLPRPVPAFAVETLEGQKVALADFDGKAILLDFWATWCEPCLEIMPKLQQLYNSYSDKGFLVLGISIDDDRNRVKKIGKFIQKIDVSYPIFVDTKKSPAWQIFKVKAIPAMFLIDRKRNIVQQWAGVIDHKEVKTEVANLLTAKENE